MTEPIGPGVDDTAADPAAAQQAAADRAHALESETFGQGSVIGELLELPAVPASGSKHVGGDDSGFAA